MGTDEFLNWAFSEVRKYVNKHYPKTELDVFDVCVVWNCKTLQNNKALLSTTLPDGMYFECTYNGEMNGAFHQRVYSRFEKKTFL